ncbi:MAG: Uma2 family endonuclease [Cyanophyceae cyanobacterium]
MVMTAQDYADLMPDATLLDSDEPEMESSSHYMQLLLLVSCLEWLWRDRHDFFIGANLTIYYSRQQLKNRDFRGPDFFVVNNTHRDPRRSWVVWEEQGRYPDVIVELLSDSTASIDRTAKKQLYQNHFRTPEYFWYSPDTQDFEGFRLNGSLYYPINPTSQGWRWSESLQLFLGVSEGQLRYFSPQGDRIPTPAEAFEQERQASQRQQIQFEQERQQTLQQLEQERQRAERLAEQLRQLGLSPDP